MAHDNLHDDKPTLLAHGKRLPSILLLSCLLCLFVSPFYQLNLSLKGRLEAEREMTKRQYKYYYGERCQIYNSQSLCGVLCGWGGG